MRLAFASAGRGRRVDRRRRAAERIGVDEPPAGRVAGFDPHRRGIARGGDDRLLLPSAPAPRPVAAGDQHERLTADVEHHARSRARNAAELRMKFPPTPAIRREGETRRRLGPALGRNQHRPRQRFARRAAIDRRPTPAGEENSARCRNGWRNHQRNKKKKELHCPWLTQLPGTRHRIGSSVNGRVTIQSCCLILVMSCLARSVCLIRLQGRPT